MEAQLDKVENSIKLFSKDVVYVGIWLNDRINLKSSKEKTSDVF